MWGSDDYELAETLVVDDKPSETEAQLKDSSAFVTVIEIDEFRDRLTTVPELLQQSVGVNVRSFGGLGAFTTVSIRGSSSEQVTILLDGVPLNRAKTGSVNLSNIPVENVERIEVYRGVSPLRFRSSSIGGVINIVTRPIGEEASNHGKLSYGSFDTWMVNGGRTATWRRLGYLVSGTYHRSAGNFSYVDDNGTRINTEDDELVERKNNAFDSFDVLGKASFEPSETIRIEAVNNLFYKDEGVPGLGSIQAENSNLKTLQNLFHLRAEKTGLGAPSLNAECSLYFVVENTRLRDPHSEIGIGVQDNENQSLAWGVDGYFSYFFGNRQLLSLLLSYQGERFDARDEASLEMLEADPQRRDTYQAGIEDEISLWRNRILLCPQVLYTYLVHDFGRKIPFWGTEFAGQPDRGFLSGKMGVKVCLQGGLVLKGNASRYFRAPNLSELFGDRGYIVGNPNLTPEEGVNWDAGLSFSPSPADLPSFLPVSGFSLEVIYFSLVANDLIVYEQTSQRTVMARNLSDAEIRGVETSWSLTLADHVRLSGNFTYQDAENTSHLPQYRGKRLPARPEKDLFNQVEVYNRFGKLFYQWTLIEGNYLDAYNTEWVPSRSIHNLGLSVYPLESIALTFEVKNLTGDQVSDALGFPLPGRAYFGTCAVTF